MVDEEQAAVDCNYKTVPDVGHPAFAAFISQDPDHEAYVFRSFNTLAARNLLNLQGELIALEKDLVMMDQEATQRSDPISLVSLRSWKACNDMAKWRETERKRQEVMEKLEVKLRKYHKALFLQSKISLLACPSKRVLNACRHGLHGANGEASLLGGDEKYMLDDRLDLVALKPPISQDLLSTTLRDHWPFATNGAAGTRFHQARHFEQRRLMWLVSVLSTAIAAFLLIGSITTLYLVTNPDARLALVITFIVLFALALSVSTGATRDSVFAATAAYAAVLVVFVSGNLGNVNAGPSQ